MNISEREREFIFWLVTHPKMASRTHLHSNDFSTDYAADTFAWVQERSTKGEPVNSSQEVVDHLAGTEGASWWAALNVDAIPMFDDGTFAYYEQKIIDGCRSRIAQQLFKMEATGASEHDELYIALQSELEEVRARIEEIRNTEQAGYIVAVDVANEVLSTPQALISTGYTKLDKAACYLEPGHVFTVLASPSVGKTALAINIVDRVVKWREGEHVAFSSLEMPTRRIFARMARARLHETSDQNAMNAILNPEPGTEHAIESFKNDYSRVAVGRWPNVDALRRAVYRLEPRPTIVVIDYLGLMDLRGQTMYERSSLGIKSVKTFAREEDLAVMLLTQINRPEKHGKGRAQEQAPTLSSARDSGQIEEMSDVMVGIHRPNFQDERDARARRVKLGVEILKNKNGEVDVFYAGMDLWQQRISGDIQWEGEAPHDR